MTASASASEEGAPLSRCSGRLIVCSRFMVVLIAAAISASVTSGSAPVPPLGLAVPVESCAAPNQTLRHPKSYAALCARNLRICHLRQRAAARAWAARPCGVLHHAKVARHNLL